MRAFERIGRCNGLGGAAITDFGSTNPASAAFAPALQSNGDVLAGGVAGTPGVIAVGPTSFALARYASMALDKTFGSNGTVVTPTGTGANNWITAVAVQSDGKIVAVGTPGSVGKKGFVSGGGYALRYLGQ